jgi:hypothetical protein
MSHDPCPSNSSPTNLAWVTREPTCVNMGILPARPQQPWGQASSGGLEARGALLTPLACIRRANRSCTENRGRSLQRTQEQRTPGMGILQRHGERDRHMNTCDFAASQRRLRYILAMFQQRKDTMHRTQSLHHTTVQGSFSGSAARSLQRDPYITLARAMLGTATARFETIYA